jgi:hypothetical protein
MRRIVTIFMTGTLISAGVSLTACGKKDDGATKVQMKDMEVVDGTATDAMTDLDGVQSEAGAAAPAANASDNQTVPAPSRAKAPPAEAEILSDQ